MNSPFRIGILVGFFYELERITANDSLQTDNGKIFARNDFDPTNRIRWELEPIIYLHTSKHFYLSITPQLKLPLWYEWRQNVGGVKKIDYRLDVPVNLEVVLSRSFTIDISYHTFYDNAPSSVKIPDVIRPDGSDVYLTANNLNQFFSIQVGYKFN
ncbi:MAG: hypothetical protein HKN92_01110 [Chitinophagales bacterium]|nr:hypothetical protein [Chitinophagales bacterium]